MTLKFSGTVHNIFWKFFGRSEQVLIFDSVFMVLQSQNFSFSKNFYSLSAIFKKTLKSANKNNFSFIIFMTYKILEASRIYIVLLGYCEHLKSYIILGKSLPIPSDNLTSSSSIYILQNKFIYSIGKLFQVMCVVLYYMFIWTKYKWQVLSYQSKVSHFHCFILQYQLVGCDKLVLLLHCIYIWFGYFVGFSCNQLKTNSTIPVNYCSPK